MINHFADKLTEAISQKQAPCVVGLDTAIELIDDDCKEALDIKPSSPRRVIAEGMLRFNHLVIDTIWELVPAVKPNSAFYERYGADGVWALEETINYAKSKGLLVILDSKRGDIGNTAQSYSKSTLGAESCTVNPYLGEDSLEPFITYCKESGSGMFVLVRTSNPGAATFQDLITGGVKLSEKVASVVSKLGKSLIGKSGYSSVGAVVGATWPNEAAQLRKIMPHSFFLVPGFGAQGGDAETVKACFDKNGAGAIVNSSRGILYPKMSQGDKYRDAIRAACEKFISDVRRAAGLN